MLIAPNTPELSDSETGEEITNIIFYPALNIADFKRAMRVENIATHARIKECLKIAIYSVNRQTAPWSEAQRQNSIATLTAVEQPPWLPDGGLIDLYKLAVYSLAKALLIERNRDIDTTAAGNKDADKLDPSADNLRRDSTWAIRDLTGQTRSTIELI